MRAAIHWVAADTWGGWDLAPYAYSRWCRFCKSGNHRVATQRSEQGRAASQDRKKPRSSRIVHVQDRGLGKGPLPVFVLQVFDGASATDGNSPAPDRRQPRI